jgi:hypothetical protein
VLAEGMRSVPLLFPSPFFPGFLLSRSPPYSHPHTFHVSDHKIFAQPEAFTQTCLISPIAIQSGSGGNLDPVANLSTTIPITTNATATHTHTLCCTMIVSIIPASDCTSMLMCSSKRLQASPRC